jgi:hypothetical protein
LKRAFENGWCGGILQPSVEGAKKMQVGDDAEVRKLISQSNWNSGITMDGTNLYYESPEANCVEMKFPDWPGRAAYFASRASTLGLRGDRANFQGALLWITYSEPGSLAPIGWKQIERMRLGYGESRSLETARAHFFRSDELLDLEAFLLPCFVFGWDAYLVPFYSNEFFVHVSHDEYWGVVAKTRTAYNALFAELTDLNPTESPGMRRRFCLASNVGDA